MSLFENFPYTNLHELNLDWIISKMIELSNKVDNALKGYIKVADPIEWDITKQYPAYTIVMDNENAYLSLQAVPYGIPISNTDYWQNIFDLSDIYKNLKNAICFNDDENSITSSENRDVNSYVWLNDKFYKVISPITMGDLYSENNIEQVALSNDVYTIIIKLNKLLHNIFPVGPGCIYTTIQSAYTDAVTNHGGTILIYPGIYDEAITMISGSDQYPINFVGMSRDNCIWKSSAFGYDYACFTGSGNLTFENLTMIKGNTPNNINGGGYALHMDYPDTEGNMYVRNCTLISYENSAIGCGTRSNQKIFIEDCTLISYDNFHHTGGLLYHSAGEAGATGQGLSLINNIILGLGENSAGCEIVNSVTNTETFEPVFINNYVFGAIFNTSQTSDYWNSIVSESLVQDLSSMTLTRMKCFNNSHGKLNFDGGINYNQQTKQANGNAYTITDTLSPEIKNGFIHITSDMTQDTPAGGGNFWGYVSSMANGTSFYLVCDYEHGGLYYKITAGGSVVVNWSKMIVTPYISQYSGSAPVYIEKQYGAIYISCNDCQMSAFNYVIPDEWRPHHNIVFAGMAWNVSNDQMYPIRVQLKTDGTFVIKCNPNASVPSADYISFNVTYPV